MESNISIFDFVTKAEVSLIKESKLASILDGIETDILDKNFEAADRHILEATRALDNMMSIARDSLVLDYIYTAFRLFKDDYSCAVFASKEDERIATRLACKNLRLLHDYVCRLIFWGGM